MLITSGVGRDRSYAGGTYTVYSRSTPPEMIVFVDRVARAFTTTSIMVNAAGTTIRARAAMNARELFIESPVTVGCDRQRRRHQSREWHQQRRDHRERVSRKECGIDPPHEGGV